MAVRKGIASWRAWLGDNRRLVYVLAVALVSRAVVSFLPSVFGTTGLTPWPWGTWTGPYLWRDFFGYYLPQLKYLSEGFLPYRDFHYSLMPFFLYSMYPFYYLGGSYAAAVPIVLSDALTAPLVYLTVNKLANNRVALVAGFAYALSPVALVTEGFLWLSSQPMTLFMILAIYLLREDRPFLSIASLATAVLFKQEALFIMLPYLFFYVRTYKTKVLRGVGLFIAIILVAVSPFLILAPVAFVSNQTYGLPLNLGPPEPSRLPTFPTDNSTTVTSSPEEPCTNTIIPNLYTGALCGTNVDVQEIPWLFLEGRILNAVSLFEPFFYIAFLAGLYVARKSPNIVELSSAYSVVGFLLIFSRLLHPIYDYYFLPAYTLMLASATNKRNLAVGTFGATATALVPGNGPFLTIVSSALLFAMVVIYDRERSQSALGTPSLEPQTTPAG